MGLSIIVVGLGQAGRHLAKVLYRESHSVVGIETVPVCRKEAGESLDIQVLQGPGTDCRILEKAGIRSADMLIALTGSDDQNILAFVFLYLGIFVSASLIFLGLFTGDFWR